MEEFKLNDGNQIPKIGFGTYKIKGYQGARAISQAIEMATGSWTQPPAMKTKGPWARQSEAALLPEASSL